MIEINLIIAFVVGVIIGIASALALRIRDVSKVSLDLKRIGLALGVEGFEQKTQPSQIHMEMKDSAGGQMAGRDIIGNQQNKIDKLEQTVQNIQKTIENSMNFEHESRLYIYKYRGDIPKIHLDLSSALDEGWFIQSITPLIDYEGRNRLWVVLSRARDGKKTNIRLVNNED